MTNRLFAWLPPLGSLLGSLLAPQEGMLPLHEMSVGSLEIFGAKNV